MKKVFAVVITLVLLVSCVVIAACPTSAVEIDYGDFDFYLRDDDNELAENGIWIGEYMGEDKEVIVPSLDPDGEPVIGIDYLAFVDNKKIESVYIVEGIKQIGDDSFKGCAMLQHVSIPYSVVDLGRCNVFQYTSIASMVVPGKVEEIPCCLIQSAGEGRGGLPKVMLTNFVISYGVKKIKQGAIFYDGEAPLIFPSTMTDIRGAFDTYRKKDMDVYILNPNCNVGELMGDVRLYKPGTEQTQNYKKGTYIPPVFIWGDRGVVRIHAPANSKLKGQIAQWKKEYPEAKYEFIAMTDAEVKEKDQWTKDNGIIAPTGYTMEEPGVVITPKERAAEEGGDGGEDAEETEEGEEDEGGTTKTKKNSKKKGNGTVAEDGTVTSGGYDLNLTPVIIVVCGFLFLIVAAIVAAVIVMNSKKKNKKNQNIMAAEEAEEEAVIESENLEEKAEETPTDEK